jgi:hypothetical protein
MMRGSGLTANLLQMSYVFKTFTHNFIETMIDLGFRKKDYKALAWMAFATAIFGTGSSIGATALIKAIGWAIGSDQPEDDFYKAIESQVGTYASDLARFGIFQVGGHGFNLKGSLAIGLGDIPTSYKDLIGAPGSVVLDIVDGFKEGLKGNLMKGAEKALPMALSSPFKAYREYTEGVTTKSNTPVFYEGKPLKADEIDTFLRFFSFNPTHISKAREVNYAESERKAGFSSARSDIYSKLKKYYLDNNRSAKGLKDIDIEIAAYNQRAKAKGETLITAKSIKAVLKRSKLAE